MNDRSGGPSKASGSTDAGSDSAVDDAGEPTRVVGERPSGGVRRVSRPLMAPNTVRQIRLQRARALRRKRRLAAHAKAKREVPPRGPSGYWRYRYMPTGLGLTWAERRRRSFEGRLGRPRFQSMLLLGEERRDRARGRAYARATRRRLIRSHLGRWYLGPRISTPFAPPTVDAIDITGLSAPDWWRRRWSPPVQVVPPTMEPADETEPGMDSATDDSGAAPIILDQEVNLAPNRPAGRLRDGDHASSGPTGGGAVSRSKQDTIRLPIELELDLTEEETDSAVDDDEPTGKPSGHLDVAPFRPKAKPAVPTPSGDTATDDSDGVTPLAMTEGGPRDLAPTVESRMVSVDDRFAQEIGVDHDLGGGEDGGERTQLASGARGGPRVAAVAAVLLLVIVAAVVLLTRGGGDDGETLAAEPTAGVSSTAAVGAGGSAATATEEPAFQIAPVPDLIICSDGTSFSGFPQPDGSVLDADTGEPRACPGSSN